MSWERLPPIAQGDAIHDGCLHAPATRAKAALNVKIAVGFGFAGISRDGEIVYREPQHDGPFSETWAKIPSLMKFENMARKDPDHDWRLILDGPLSGKTYQRQDRNEWLLVQSNRGFA